LKTDSGQLIDVAEVDAAVLWRFREINAGLNGGGWRDDAVSEPEPASRGAAVRYQYYETKDGKYVMFQAFEWKFWVTFCTRIGRPDLLGQTDGDASQHNPNEMDNATGDEFLWGELTEIFKTKTQAEWVGFFMENNIPGGPQHSLREVIDDPHFIARDNLVHISTPEVGELEMAGTPIKLPGQTFETTAAPLVGQDTRDILSQLLHYDTEQISQLAEAGVIDQGS
jgi:crotonobetainyl-CoA:carnitine CoA-transferase CaiB-like acyl-CoA transferase